MQLDPPRYGCHPSGLAPVWTDGLDQWQQSSVYGPLCNRGRTGGLMPGGHVGGRYGQHQTDGRPIGLACGDGAVETLGGKESLQ